MPRIELFLFSAIILLGFLDWLTTVTGLFFFGATEVNPLLSGLTKSNMILFSFVKLSAAIFIGLALHKAAVINKSGTETCVFQSRFLYGGYSLTFLMLTAVVGSNVITLLRV